MIEVTRPDEPPQLTDRGWRAVLGLLIAEAEHEDPDWRDHLEDDVLDPEVSNDEGPPDGGPSLDSRRCATDLR
jgi:hypothetical protein